MAEEWVKAYLGLGSNLGDRMENIRTAVKSLSDSGRIKVCRISSLYETEPEKVLDQPKFINCAVEIETSYSPGELLTEIKRVEKHLGRKKGIRWGPRIIDIDIIIYDKIVMDEEGLRIPHREFENRSFVLVPLAEIAPDLRSPLSGRAIEKLAMEKGGEKKWLRWNFSESG